VAVYVCMWEGGGGGECRLSKGGREEVHQIRAETAIISTTPVFFH